MDALIKASLSRTWHIAGDVNLMLMPMPSLILRRFSAGQALDPLHP